MVWLDNLHPIQHLWLMGSPKVCHSFPRSRAHLRPLSERAWARKKADTVFCLVTSMIQVVGIGKALATDKIPLKCTQGPVGAANAFVMDNPTACKSQELYDRLIQAVLDSQGSTC